MDRELPDGPDHVWYTAGGNDFAEKGYQQSAYDQCLFHAWRNNDGPIDPSETPDHQHDDFILIGFHVGSLAITVGAYYLPQNLAAASREEGPVHVVL